MHRTTGDSSIYLQPVTNVGRWGGTASLIAKQDAEVRRMRCVQQSAGWVLEGVVAKLDFGVLVLVEMMVSYFFTSS